jgi:CRISPR-associated endonuclease/helicase Cas3
METALRRWLPAAFEADAPPLPDVPRFQHLVAGLAALADWIGSDRDFFPFSEPFDPAYNATAHKAAAEVLAKIGVDPGALAERAAPDFAKLTGFAEPRPAQAAVGALGPEARLAILEAETGSGKTEAALWRYTQLLAARKVSGLYFAVPTRAAARQLHGRINAALGKVYRDAAPEAVLAIPGMLRAGEAEGRKLPHWRVLWEDRANRALERWAAEHATRFLAAPVAVGTVDQAMLAAMQVKHAHLRGSALSRSLLVIDEVHASDPYMTAILQRLLDAHLATGGYALLMSATLGARARVGWTGEGLPDAGDAAVAPYPAVWVQGEAQPRVPRRVEREKAVDTEIVATMDPHETARNALAAAQAGARVLVIRNTVDKAVETWRVVQEAGGAQLLLQAAGRPALHHGRFAAEDRALLDKAAETALATDPARSREGCIVIGTQTLEQSLDIDADLLISDLCPVDVLLQRIGRLHRHDLPRPEGFETPRVLVLLPERGLDRLTEGSFENGLGGWERDGRLLGIYRDLAGLELTRRLIDEHPVWRIPAMNRLLVEGATHPAHIEALIAEKGEAWDRYQKTVGGTEAAERQVAELNVLDRRESFEDVDFRNADEKIMTRLGEEGPVLTLDPVPIGPFGQTITRITLPAHWSHGIDGAQPVMVTQAEEGLFLRVGEKAFRYGLAGLMKEQSNR